MKFFHFILSVLLVSSASLANSDSLEGLDFTHYTSSETRSYNLTTLPNLLSSPLFDSSKSTVFFLYGNSQSRVVAIKDAYLANGNYNFLLLNINQPINYTFENVPTIGEKVAQGIVSLIKSGFSSPYELVGFSIGAQLAGYIGRNVINNSSGEFIVPRIVALEPATNFFALRDVRAGDAAFVMTVHTTYLASNVLAVGDVAFWFNDGQQPMCWILGFIPDLRCSHEQVQLYWMEAVQSGSETVFPARKCDNVKQFLNDRCDKNIPLGYVNTKTATTLRGNYFLSTNRNSPYSKSDASA